MDLASFIPGITNTGTFSPGSTTPPPFNVSHTGLTDGTGPSTSSKNMAEVYNRILLQIAATIASAGITIDNNNWTQLPAAVTALVNQALSGFTSSITTPPQFDNDTSIATSEFVQRALGNMRGITQVSASGTVVVTAADAGRVYYVTASGVTFNLNPSGLLAGSTFTIITDSVATSLVMTTSGSILPASTLVTRDGILRPRCQYQFIWDGTNFRYLNGGSFNEDFYPFSSSAGYTKMPSGFMMEWGIDSTSIGETTRTVLFPWAFPNACAFAAPIGISDGTTITNNNIPQIVSRSTGSFTYFNQGIAEPTNPVSPNQGISWLAIGF